MDNVVQTYLVDDTYPPEDHILRDLSIRVEADAVGRAVIRAPVTANVCSAAGVLYVGVLAALVDVVGGVLAVPVISPDWLSTANMSLVTTRDICAGRVSGHGRILRCGRNSVVVGVEIQNETGGSAGMSSLAGMAMISYSRLSGNQRGLRIKSDGDSHPVLRFSLGRAPLKQALADKAGVHIVDAASGRLRINMSSYVRNSLDSLQGGITALLADIAGQLAANAACRSSWQTRDLTIHYMSPGLKGPFETETETLRLDDHNALLRVQIRDRGDGNRLMAVIFNSVAVR